jgi:hypothetical protein
MAMCDRGKTSDPIPASAFNPLAIYDPNYEAAVKSKTPAPLRKSMTPDDTEQSQRFVDMARELEADETGGEFRKALKKIAPLKERG